MKSKIKQGVFIVLISIVLLSLCSLLLVGCVDTSEDEVDKVVSGITLDTRNAQTEFFVGDKFSTLGLGIVVDYEDGSQELILASGNGVEIVAPSLDAIGRKKVSVQYKTFLAEYTINVSRLDGIELALSNVQVEYTVGDEFSAFGIVVSAKITTLNEMDEEVTFLRTLSATDYTVAAPDMSTSGQKTVTVTYQGKTANYTVNVKAAPVLEGIVVDASKAKTKFRVGDTFTYDGIVVTAIYSDNNEKVVTNFTVSTPDMSTVGVKTVTVTYEGKTGDYTINVLGADSDPILTEIKLDTGSVKLVYRVGDTLNASGLVVTGIYDVGEDKTLGSSDYTVSADLSQAGEVDVTVAAQGIEQRYIVYVLPAEADVWNTLVMDQQGGSGNKLTVYAMSCNGRGNGTPSLTEGWSFFELANGGYRLLPFICNHLGPDGWWGTEFPSNNGEVTTSIGSSGELVTVYGGVTYTAEQDYWHARILDWTDEATSVTLTTAGDLNCVVGGEFNWQVLAVVANLKTGSNNVDITDKCVVTVSEVDATQVGATTIVVTIAYTYDDFGIVRTQTITQQYTALILPDVATADTIVFDTVNGATLKLFVTERNVEEIATKGVIFYKSADGVYEVVHFTFADGELVVGSEQWTASFDQEGNLTVANAQTEFTCSAAVVNTVLFKADKTLIGIIWNEKREYVVGSAFEINPIRKYSDGSTENLDASEYTVTEPDMSTVGVKTVTLSYLADSSYDVTFQIYCIPQVNWDTNKLNFGQDVNGSGATLELFVTNRSAASGWWGTPQNSQGWLLVKNVDGTYEMYEYEFYLDGSVTSHPYPNGAPNGLNSYLNDGGNLVIEINGKKFAATNNDLWHLIVIGWQ